MPKLSASNNCGRCNKPLPRSEFMRCSTCKVAYDLECINVNNTRFNSFYRFDKKRREEWNCRECLNRKPNNGNLNTPTRQILSPDQTNNVTHRSKPTLTPRQEGIADISGDGSNIYSDSRDSSPLNPANELKQFLEEMRAVRNEMCMFRSVVSDLTAAIKTQNQRLDALEDRITILEGAVGTSDGVIISNLEETVARLKLEIEERDQEMLANDIEIAGFPETNNENSTHVILTVANKLGVQLDERDVVSAARVGAPRDTAPGTGARPRPVVVRLARRTQRDALLQAARVRRRLTTEGTALPASAPARPFYINERLSRFNRQLFQKTREIAKRLCWMYVWTRDGKIFAREDNGKARHRIRSEADYLKVFGVDPFGESQPTN